MPTKSLKLLIIIIIVIGLIVYLIAEKQSDNLRVPEWVGRLLQSHYCAL